MPSPPARPRQAALLAALVGCALAIGQSRTAEAAGCHAPDRPVFGLSTPPEIPAAPAPEGLAPEEPEPVRIDRRCPSEDPERPTSRGVSTGEPPMASAVEHAAPDPRRPADPDGTDDRPIGTPSRIDRPPRTP